MTPGLPTTRLTMSWLLFTDTAGVTSQPPRRDCSTAAEAPAWPSIWAYAARIARRLNQKVAASRPAGIATRMPVTTLTKMMIGMPTTSSPARKKPATSSGRKR